MKVMRWCKEFVRGGRISTIPCLLYIVVSETLRNMQVFNKWLNKKIIKVKLKFCHSYLFSIVAMPDFSSPKSVAKWMKVVMREKCNFSPKACRSCAGTARCARSNAEMQTE